MNCNTFSFTAVRLWNEVVQTVFSFIYTEKVISSIQRALFYGILMMFLTFESETNMALVSEFFCLFFGRVSILLPVFRVAFLSFQKPLCMLFVHTLWWLYCLPYVKRGLFYCRFLHRLYLQYIMVVFHKTLKLCSLGSYFQNW